MSPGQLSVKAVMDWHAMYEWGYDPNQHLELQAKIEAAIRAAVAEEREALLAMVDQWWSFNNDQRHTHTWHDKQDCLEAIRKRAK